MLKKTILLLTPLLMVACTKKPSDEFIRIQIRNSVFETNYDLVGYHVDDSKAKKIGNRNLVFYNVTAEFEMKEDCVVHEKSQNIPYDQCTALSSIKERLEIILADEKTKKRDYSICGDSPGSCRGQEMTPEILAQRLVSIKADYEKQNPLLLLKKKGERLKVPNVAFEALCTNDCGSDSNWRVTP